MNRVVIYTSPWCPYCIRAKALLEEKQVPYEEIDVSSDPQMRQRMLEESGGWTVPQIFIGGKPIGGCDELYALDRSGELRRLLEGSPAAASSSEE